jgi:hypothetical protein
VDDDVLARVISTEKGIQARLEAGRTRVRAWIDEEGKREGIHEGVKPHIVPNCADCDSRKRGKESVKDR